MASKYERLEEENTGVQVQGYTDTETQPKHDIPYAPPGEPDMIGAAPPPYNTPVVNVWQTPAPTTIIRSTVLQMPPTYMTMSILSCLFCCWPFGICAIIKSNEVSDHWASGNIQAALEASESAKQWGRASIITGLILNAISVTLTILYYTVLINQINTDPY